MSPPQPSPSSSPDAPNQSGPEASQTSCAPTSSATAEFSKEERTLLLQLAHDSIRSALDQTEIPLEPPTPHLAEPRGAFTSLYLHGQLRGCVGYVLPVSPVYRAVLETARAAAFED